MKKIFLILLSVVMLFSTGTTTKALATNSDNSTTKADISSSAKSSQLKLNARHAIVIEETSGRVIYEKAAYEKTAMASTTKLMTALVTVTHIDIDSTTTVSKKAASIGGSVVDLKQGEEISIKDLLYCLMLRSGNDAAIALAEAVGGTVEEFCVMMNSKAKDIGAKNTCFTSPHGLDNENHYTTAYDLALICRAASQNITVKQIMGTKHYTCGDRFLINTNPFLGTIAEVTGGKTGFTNNAGRCIAITAEKNNMSIIVIIIGCTDTKTRQSDGKKLISHIYDNYSMVNIYETNEPVAALNNPKNRYGEASVLTANKLSLPLSEAEQSNLSKHIEIENKSFPLSGQKPTLKTDNEYEKGKIVGKITVATNDGETLAVLDCFISSPIVEKDFKYYLKKVVVCWFCGML